MINKLLLLILAVLYTSLLPAQTFTGTGGAIPDSGAVQVNFPVNVTGVNTLSSAYGLARLCINITHSWVSDLEIYLKSPDGTTIPISIQNGGSGNNYNGTCFTGSATIAIGDAVAPFSGTYIPDGYMGAVNNGQNGNGIWILFIKDVAAGETGILNSWSISFSDNLPPTPPECNNNPPPGNSCINATAVCSFYGYCASTSASFTADTWPELDSLFCGTVQNNAFLKFVATGPYMDFNVWVTSSTNHDGIQMQFFEGTPGGAVINNGCYSPIRPGSSPNVVTASDLIPGQTYYLMIDGYAGDICNYAIEPLPKTGALSITASAASICAGSQVQLTAFGGNGSYYWSGNNLSSNSGSTVTATPQASGIYTVSSTDPGGLCPNSKQLTINIIPLPPPPIVSASVIYCQAVSSTILSANGSSLLWYNSLTGGAGSSFAPLPSTALAGNQTYYVTQNTGLCESQRAAITVTINARPVLGKGKKDTICINAFADLTRKFALWDLDTKWSYNNQSIPPPQAVNRAGAYRLEASNNSGCKDTAFITLVVQPAFRVFAGRDTIAVKGVPFSLHCSPANSYSWKPAGLLNLSDIQNPTAVLYNDQQFIVTAKDIAGCEAEDSILVKILKESGYHIPTAFTPNDDGLNDYFRPVPVDIAYTIFFRVLNRYGSTVYQNNQLGKGWDGKFANTLQPAGTYVWQIKGISTQGKIVERKGTVVLIR